MTTLHPSTSRALWALGLAAVMSVSAAAEDTGERDASASDSGTKPVGEAKTTGEARTFFFSSEDAALMPNAEALHDEFGELRRQLDVPGMAYVIVRDGAEFSRGAFGSVREGEEFSRDTPLSIASITKSVTAVTILRLAERGIVDLGASVLSVLPDAEVPPEVRIEHLLSHTSEGYVAEEYVYGASRYGLLAPIIEARTERSFETVIREEVIEPSGMRWFDSPNLSAGDGLVSTATDLSRFLIALDTGRLLKKATQARLSELNAGERHPRFPAGLGFFAQTLNESHVLWGYGQGYPPDNTGALLLRMPEHNLSLALLGNNTSISDPFRLLAGDVGKSPFALAFYRLLIASPAGRPQERPINAVTGTSYPLRAAAEDELIAAAIVAGSMDDADLRDRLLSIALDQEGVAERKDPPLHYYLTSLGDEYLETGIAMGQRLLVEHPNNPWILDAQGGLLHRAGRDSEAEALFLRIVELPNQNDDRLRRSARAWAWLALAEIYMDREPEKARGLLQQILETDTFDWSRGQARTLLDQMSAEPK